jgi:Zn-dependent protease with chaperone function
VATRSGVLQARRDAFEEFRLRLVDSYADRLVAGMSTARPDQTRSLTLARLIGALVVLPVHVLSLASLIGGLYLLALGDTWPERVAGAFLLLVCYGVHPELPKRPRHVARLTPESAPATYALVREVGEKIGARVPDEILVDTDFNAGVTRVGLRRQILVLGAPLWVATPRQARVALLAHELGHFAPHDVSSSLWVSTASHTLRKWSLVFEPPRGRPTATQFGGGVGVLLVQRLLFPVLRALIDAYRASLDWANAPAHRRQEMLADLDAARIAGTHGALSLFDTLLARLSVETAIASAAVDGRRPDIWTVVRERLATRGPQEMSRAREAARAERTRIDGTHPATTLRIRLLEFRAREPAAVVPSGAHWDRVEAELAGPLAAAAKSLGERIRYRR